MSFISSSAPRGQRVDGVLSADNLRPERHVLLDLLRRAAPDLGLKAPALLTLEALLSFLPPRRDHDVVFASNASLCFRRGGITCRTLRRHVETLESFGLLCRTDSPNGKRFTRRDPMTGEVLRFGFDLAPLFRRLSELAARAEQAAMRAERLAFLRTKLRALAHRRLALDPRDAQALAAVVCLRRKSDEATFEEMIADLTPDAVENSPRPQPGPVQMSATDSQNVRHHQTSEKERIDRREPDEPVPLPILIAACPDTVEFALEQIDTVERAVRHGRTMSTMLGIDGSVYRQAEARLGTFGAAVTVWALVQMRDGIAHVGRYFHSLTLGRRSAGFDPAALIRGLAQRRAGQGARFCPRTI